MPRTPFSNNYLNVEEQEDDKEEKGRVKEEERE